MHIPGKSLLLAAIRRSWRVAQSLTVNFSVDGRVIPVMHGMGVYHTSPDPGSEWFGAELRRMVEDRPGALVDVGASVGGFLLYWMPLRRPYYGFEPHVACAHYLDRLVTTNRLADCHVMPVGLSDRPGVLMLASNTEHDVKATTLPDFYAQSWESRKPIPVDTGDTWLEAMGAGDIAVVKVDVEGAELEVLRGLKRVIERSRPLLIIEVAPYQHLLDSTEPEQRRAGEFRRDRVTELEELLRSYGYTFQRIEYGRGYVSASTLHHTAGFRDMDFLCTPT